jgi:hypothetical protein
MAPLKWTTKDVKAAIGCSPIAKPTCASIWAILIGTVDEEADNTGRNSGRFVQMRRSWPPVHFVLATSAFRSEQRLIVMQLPYLVLGKSYCSWEM